jgi:hypothetical protein
MIWLYERNGATARVETSYDNDTHEYVLRWVDHPLGADVIERFRDAAVFRTRLVALEAQMTAEEWRLSGSPQIDPEGFPRTRPKQ